MNAKQLNEIFERQRIGHDKLVRPIFDSDGSTEVHAIVVDDDINESFDDEFFPNEATLNE